MNPVICADAQPSKSDKVVVERPLWQELSFWFHCDFEIKGNYTIIQNIFVTYNTAVLKPFHQWDNRIWKKMSTHAAF